MNLHPLLRRALIGAGIVTLVGTATVGPASAHVSPDPSEAPAGGYATIEFQVPHGCEGSATTGVAIQVPDGITSVTPETVPGWEVTTRMEQLDQPLDDGHGGQITERTAEVTWTGGPIPDDRYQTFGLSVKLPDGQPGDVVAFPTIQSCEQGQTDWISLREPGEDEPDHPAPAVTLTAAEGHGDDVDDVREDLTQAAGVSAPGSDDGVDAISVVALVVGAGGLAAGGTALVMARRRG